MNPQDIIHRSDHFRAVLFGGHSDRLIVTFDHWKRGKSDFGEARYAGFWAKKGVSQLSLKTRANDWFVNEDTTALEAVLRDLSQRFDVVHTLGFSMGGYAALRLSKAIAADQAVLVSPQFSVWPEHVGDSQWCKRYEGSADAIHGALRDHGERRQNGVLVFDPLDAEDARHARLCLATFPNLKAVPLPFAGHPAHQLIADGGQFRVFQKAALNPAHAPKNIRASFKALRRQSDRYRKNLERYLAKRRSRNG